MFLLIYIYIWSPNSLIVLVKWGYVWGNGASLQDPTTSVEVLRVKTWL